MGDRVAVPNPRRDHRARPSALAASRPASAGRFALPSRPFAPAPAGGRDRRRSAAADGAPASPSPALQRTAGEPPATRPAGTDLLARTTVHRHARGGDRLPRRAPIAPGSGRPLPFAVRAGMEHAFGADFGGVRIHQGAEAGAVGALAYTRGDHIHFAIGRYSPRSLTGRRLLGHELAHVVQQRQGQVAVPAEGLAINDDPRLERSAEAAGLRAAHFTGTPVGWTPATAAAGGAARPPAAAAVQRQPDEETPLLGAPVRTYGTASTPHDRQEEEERRRQYLRQRDHDRLAELLDVGEHGDARLPNQVSPDEFGELAGLYSGIREGGTSLKLQRPGFDDDPWQEFEGKTMGDLGKILQTPSGRDLLRTLAGGSRQTTIGLEKNPSKAHQRAPQDVHYLSQVPRDAQVRYAAGKDFDKHSGGESLFGTSDTVLYHELTHALHSTRGRSEHGKLTADELGPDHRDIGVNKEEYATTGLGPWAHDPFTENRYRAEQSQLQTTREGRERYAPRQNYRLRKRKAKTKV